MDAASKPQDPGVKPDKNKPQTPKTSFQLKTSTKGVENAKKRLRAFSIQKKTPLTPLSGQTPKALSSGSATVIIGKFAGAKVTPKHEDPEQKKPPKPPKPGVVRRALQESYTDQQKRTLTEIEEMKKKMELVDLGIPLGLIYPTSSSDKAMPTKAMPPIKTFLDPGKLDEIINEAKKAKAEGRTFKFDYNKLLPDYDNPFQRKKEEQAAEEKKKEEKERERSLEKSKDRKYDRHHDERRHSYKKDDRDSRRDDRERRRETSKDSKRGRERKDTEKSDKDAKETDVNLNDYLVCDSWSLDNEEKTSSSSPIHDSKTKEKDNKPEEVKIVEKPESPIVPPEEPVKMQRLQPVIDSFKFELDEEDDYLDIFDENIEIQKFTKKTPKKDDLYDSPVDMRFLDSDATKDSSDALSLTDDTFLESVINEIKLEAMSDEGSQDKGLVEYDSPIKDEDYSPSDRISVTPELDDRMRDLQSSRSDYSDGYRSIESGYKSTESGYKSTESGYKSTESGCKSTESGYKSTESGYKSTESGYKSTESGYKSTESGYKSTGSEYKSKEEAYKSAESGYKSLEGGYKSTDGGYKPTEGGYKSTEGEYKSTAAGYKSAEVGYKSTESGYKSTESGYTSTGSYKSADSCYSAPDSFKSRESYPQSVNYRSGVDYPVPTTSYNVSDSFKNEQYGTPIEYKGSVKAADSRSDSYRTSDMESQIQKITMDSLETWSFVMKICQPLLFRHDRNKCYKETRVGPKLWYTENPKTCNCVKDRSVVYEELEMCKMGLVDKVYGCDQIPDVVQPKNRTWYPRLNQCLTENVAMQQLSSEWEADDSQNEGRKATPQRRDEVYLDREYQRFMEAVWPEVSEAKTATSRSTTPVKQETRKKKKTEEDKETDKKKAKKIKLSSDGWSQESDVEEVEKNKKAKLKEKSRKRKHSPSLSDSESDAKKKKKSSKKKANKKQKAKESKRKLKNKLKKLKDKQKKKLLKVESDEEEKESKRKDKSKKKKLLKKKKALKKKKSRKQSTSSSSSTSTTNSSDSEEETQKKKREGKKKRKQSSSESTQSEELFDVNILNNIKTERLTDDEKNHKMDFSPRRKPREIINVKELQNDFVGSNILIKKEVDASPEKIDEVKEFEEDKSVEMVNLDHIVLPEGRYPEKKMEVTEKEEEVPKKEVKVMEKEVKVKERERKVLEKVEVESKIEAEVKEPIPSPALRTDEATHSQSSQDSIFSKEDPPYEKDDSHLRPSSQNSNYNFNDVINASHTYHKEEGEETQENYEQGNYEMYEQLAMAYQSDVAKQPPTSHPEAQWWGSSGTDPSSGSQPIETVLGGRRGEIKCDWRAGDEPASGMARSRPSRWGLKPGEVNIVLTGGNTEQYPIPSVVEPVYQIQSLANRSENNSMGYDEAYEDMYGASDRLQYGDCFGEPPPQPKEGPPPSGQTSSLDDRINRVLRDTILGEVTKDVDDAEPDKESARESETQPKPSRNVKRVSFADGYKPGQDSDVEEPPIKKKRPRRVGCAWPCPATHRDHVPLWDALPPPPPPPGSPPRWGIATLPYARRKTEPSVVPNFMPPEPPPGLISFT